MPRSLAEDLAWSLVSLSAEVGLAQVSVRALARRTRMAPGTVTNHYASKGELVGICATVVGRWLASATAAHVDVRGALGLFPDTEDRTYRWLVSTWAQLRSAALTDPALDVRVRDADLGVVRAARWALAETTGERSPHPATWRCLENLRHDLVGPGTTLTPESALTMLVEVAQASRTS